MNYKAGDFLELANGRTVRLTQETAEIASAAFEDAAAPADCDNCGKRTVVAALTGLRYEDTGQPDGSFCDDCAGV